MKHIGETFKEQEWWKKVSVDHEENFGQPPSKSPDPRLLKIKCKAIIVDKDGQKPHIDIL
jgi:hypothetical protein